MPRLRIDHPSHHRRKTMSNRTSHQACAARDFSNCKEGAAKRVLADIRELAPAIAARAAEFDAERRMPSDVVDVLKAVGGFRLFVPRSHGGMELDLPSGLAVITALAKVDGSVGWTGMIGS